MVALIYLLMELTSSQVSFANLSSSSYSWPVQQRFENHLLHHLCYAVVMSSDKLALAQDCVFSFDYETLLLHFRSQTPIFWSDLVRSEALLRYLPGPPSYSSLTSSLVVATDLHSS